MREKRDEIIILRTTKAEKNRIYEKMLGMGIRSLSAYIPKMALDGYCLNLDLPQLRQVKVQAIAVQCHFGDIGTQAADAHAQHFLIDAVLLCLCGSQDDDFVPLFPHRASPSLSR